MCWLAVSGPDAAEFLQGQFTNDLRHVSSTSAVYGLWLNVKGKVVADSFVLRSADGLRFWVGSYFCTAATVRERLESHVIADDVTIEDETERWSAITVFGRPQVKLSGFVLQFAGRRDRSAHYECVFPVDHAAEVFRAFDGAPEITRDEAEARRIAAAIPAIPRDIGPGDLPNEAGLEAEAISFTKGCYLGQEVMARLKSMGQIRRRLLRVTGPATLPATLPAPLYNGEKQIGELRSAMTFADGELHGLAMVTLLHAPPGSLVALAPGGTATLRLWPSS
jgi:tRNA-modifying protein YgfZ